MSGQNKILGGKKDNLQFAAVRDAVTKNEYGLDNSMDWESFYDKWISTPELSKIKPLRNSVLIRQDPVKIWNNDGSIIVNIDTRNHRKPQMGTVLAVADDCVKIKVGQRVFFSMYAGVNVKYVGLDFVLMKEREVFGIVNGDIKDFEIGDTKDVEEIMEAIADKYNDGQ